MIQEGKNSKYRTQFISEQNQNIGQLKKQKSGGHYLFSDSFKSPSAKQERKYVYVRRFVNALKKKVEENSSISNEFIDYVGDNAASKQQNGFNLNFKLLSTHMEMELKMKFQEKMKDLVASSFGNLILWLSRIELFKPESPIKIVWDLASLVSRLYFLFLIPLDVVWNKYSFMFDVYYIQSFVFLLILFGDLLVGLNTSYYTEGILVTERKKIVKHNFLKCYGLEWISTIQIMIYLILSQNEEIQTKIKDYKIYLTLITFLVHYNTIQECLIYYEEGLNLNKKASSILQLIKLIGALFFIVHFFSCFWFYIGEYSHRVYGTSWMEKIVDEDWTVQYVYSVYFSAVTIFTVGYGDVTPQSNLEKIVCCFFIVCSSLQLPYSINTVGMIVQQITEYGEDKRKKLRIINSFMQRKQIPFNLQNEVRQYLNYFWQLDKEQDAQDVDFIINQLSEMLKNKLVQESNSIILNQCALFRYRFTAAFKAELIKSLKRKILPPETLVAQKNQLVYIEQGKIDLYGDRKCNMKLASFSKGTTLGLISFLLDCDKPETYKSHGFSLVMTLSQKKFLKILTKYPADYEIYCQIKDYLIFNGNETSIFPRSCYICKSNQHYSKDCPQVHYVADREKIIKQLTIDKQQTRAFAFRKRGRINQYGKDMKQSLEKNAFIIQQQNSDIVRLYDLPEKIDDQIRINNLDCYKNIKLGIKDNQLNKKKFQQLVRKVVLINKSYPQFIINAFQSFRASTNYFSIFSQLKQMQIRYDYLKQIGGIDLHLLETLDFYIKKNIETPLITKLELDSPKNFIHYNPKCNFDNVNINQDKNKIRIITQFLYYVLYPAQIIRQVHATKCTVDLITYKRRNNIIKT
ncbi:unnamed protein product [Paramecium pentaurelia]|uniref:Cyclic nucleotide-binding domain-containing protein n=1 Tax=Paramecium pentaurelia TaxID=43138 RepID=A0A8S1VVZ0_9CILI|nr:unnamed protein product [Paramecium pentaurelia]